MTDVLATLRPPCWCPCTWAPTWRLHTKLYKFGWNTFPNNARKNYRTDQARLFIYQSSFISQFLDLINWMGTLFFIFDGVTLQTSHWWYGKSYVLEPCQCWQAVSGKEYPSQCLSDPHSAITLCATIFFFSTFDVICDLLLNRRTETSVHH